MDDIGGSINDAIRELCKIESFQGIDSNKLDPLSGWHEELNQASLGIFAGIQKSLLDERCNFLNTGADNLPHREKKLLQNICNDYIRAMKENDQSKMEVQLEEFMNEVYETIFSALEKTVGQENKRIQDAMRYLMQTYLQYVREGINKRSPDWNLAIGDYVLDGIEAPEIKLSALNAEIQEKVEQRIEQRTRDVQRERVKEERRWYTLWLKKHKETYTYTDKENYNVTVDVNVKCFPEVDALCTNIKEQLANELNFLFAPFVDILITYIKSATQTVELELNRVENDIKTKLDETQKNLDIDHEKVEQQWNPIHQQSKDFQAEVQSLKNSTIYGV